MYKNLIRLRQATDNSIIQRMRIECWITNATDTHSDHVILTVFPQQQWLRERASGLRYTYITCLGFFIVKGRHTFEIISRCCVKLCFGKDNKCLHYYYLAGCPMFPHLPAPISQSCDLSPPIVSISPIFFL